MLSYGSKAWIDEEARSRATPMRFACPKCNAKPHHHCHRVGGYDICMTHKEREAVWHEYASKAAGRLAWLESMALPYFEMCIEDYLVAGKRPKRRKVDIQIALKRIEELRLLLDDRP